jgi:hypothetical protein
MKVDATVKTLIIVLLDLLAVLFIALMGDISQSLGYPMYILDPMRIMVFLAIAFTARWNGYLLALLLPLVSFILGGHPYFLKTALMMAELSLNVWLFWFLIKHIGMPMLSTLMSIVFSKAVYYLLKFLFITWGMIDSALLSTPWGEQITSTSVIAIFIFVAFFFQRKFKERIPT